MYFSTLSALFTLGLAATSSVAISVRTVTNIPLSDEYSRRCEGKHTDQHYPCFTFNHGSLANDAVVQMSGEEVATSSNFFLKKDGQYRDFTIAEPNKKFTLNWNEGSILLMYQGLDKNGCYSIIVEAEKGYDIGVTSDDNKEADTTVEGDKNAPGRRVAETGPICSKWSQIYVYQ